VKVYQMEQPTADLQGYVTIKTSRQIYSLINPNRIAYVYIVGIQSKCKYIFQNMN